MKTTQLVDRIKCEARTALQSKIITLLQKERKHEHDKLIDRLIEELGKKSIIARNELETGSEKKFYDQYIKMAIAFNFTFDISVENKAIAQLDLLKPFGGGSFGFGMTETGDLTRQNIRNFIVSYEFGTLLSSDIEGCGDAIFTHNYIYPISGSIGLKELVDTFVDLNMKEKLDVIEKQRVFADTLTFTTALISAGGPSAKFVIAGRSLQVLDASISGTASRTDVHKVIIGLSTPSEPQKLPSTVRATAAHSPLPFSLPGSAQNPGVSAARNAAIQATINQRFNTFLDRFGDVTLRP